MTQIATDLRNTLESARRIRFEPNRSIAATNVQTAIDEAASEGISPAPVVVTATGAIPTSAVQVQTNQSAPITLTVPDSEAWFAANGRYGEPLSIFDVSGAASTNNVTINFTGGQTADGLASLSIAQDFGGWRLERKNGGGWVVI